MIHGFWLRFILESYLDFLINLFLHVRTLSFSTASDGFTSIFALISLTLYLTFPLGLVRVLSKFPIRENMESLCGELRSPASFFGIFLARRTLFASTLVWIAD
jgi:hypothetical protein